MLLAHSIQLFEKNLEEMGILRVGKVTLDFAPNKASTACQCYTRAAQKLGFRKLVIDESGLDMRVVNLLHSDKRRTNGFPIDCYKFPLGAAADSGLRVPSGTVWTFSDRLDYDSPEASNYRDEDIRGGRDKVMDHAAYVVGGEPSDDPGQLPFPRRDAGIVSAR
jgi:hypothetical protein